jgi:hypothetical protein
MKQLILGTLVTLTLFAQVPDQTFGMINGRYWRTVPEWFRLGYIAGFNDHYAWTGSKEAWFKATFSAGEVQEAVDEFFKDPANSALPVPVGIAAVRMRFNGEPPEQIESYVRAGRSVAAMSDAPAKTGK